jgi:hypothetical protein
MRLARQTHIVGVLASAQQQQLVFNALNCIATAKTGGGLRAILGCKALNHLGCRHAKVSWCRSLALMLFFCIKEGGSG